MFFFLKPQLWLNKKLKTNGKVHTTLIGMCPYFIKSFTNDLNEIITNLLG
jgi:hypothetical protein